MDGLDEGLEGRLDKRMVARRYGLHYVLRSRVSPTGKLVRPLVTQTEIGRCSRAWSFQIIDDLGSELDDPPLLDVRWTNISCSLGLSYWLY